MFDAAAWKMTAFDQGAIYRIQITGLDNQTRDYVESVLSDWQTSGEGYSPKGQVLIFTKQFNKIEEWDSWVRAFKKFDLRLIDRDGKIKKKIRGKEEIKIIENRSRVCGKCNQPGHNARTCWEHTRKMSSK